jgi:hypothetical protein
MGIGDGRGVKYSFVPGLSVPFWGRGEFAPFLFGRSLSWMVQGPHLGTTPPPSPRCQESFAIGCYSIVTKHFSHFAPNTGHWNSMLIHRCVSVSLSHLLALEILRTMGGVIYNYEKRISRSKGGVPAPVSKCTYIDEMYIRTYLLVTCTYKIKHIILCWISCYPLRGSTSTSAMAGGGGELATYVHMTFLPKIIPFWSCGIGGQCTEHTPQKDTHNK